MATQPAKAGKRKLIKMPIINIMLNSALSNTK